jgi:antitoxin component of MazEF toxin-antitoxin module
VELGGKSATGIEVPDDVVEKLGAGNKPAVKVTVGGHTYPSTIARMGGRFMIPLSAANRTSAGVAAGDPVSVEIVVDTEPRVVTVPADFAAALKKTAAARKQFDSLSYSNQRRWVMSVEDAKTAETRQRRIDKAVSTLRDGGK